MPDSKSEVEPERGDLSAAYLNAMLFIPHPANNSKIISISTLFTLFFSLVLAPPSASASSVVVYYTNEWVVIATDSLAVRTSNGKVIQRIVGCKIDETADSVMVMDGYVFDSRSIALKVFNQPGDFDYRAERFSQEAVRSLGRLYIRQDPTFQEHPEWATNQDYVLGSVFASFEKQRLKFRIEKLWLNANLSPTPVRRESVTSKLHLPNGYIWFYAAGLAVLFPRETAYSFVNDLNMTPEHAAENIIRSDITKYPDRVGLPISILRIDKLGKHWVQRGGCKFSSQ